MNLGEVTLWNLPNIIALPLFWVLGTYLGQSYRSVADPQACVALVAGQGKVVYKTKTRNRYITIPAATDALEVIGTRQEPVNTKLHDRQLIFGAKGELMIVTKVKTAGGAR